MNYISSWGSIISIVSSLLFIYILFDLLSKQELTLANNYWRVPAFFESTRGAALTETASTLEWSLSSPPAFHTYNSLPLQS